MVPSGKASASAGVDEDAMAGGEAALGLLLLASKLFMSSVV